MTGRRRHSLDAAALAREMRARGYQPVWLDRDMFVVDIDGSVLGFRSTNTPTTNCIAVRAAKRKPVARALLAAAGVTVAEGAAFLPHELEAAAAFADSLGAPVVIKPASGRKGRQVTVGVTGREQFERAFAEAAQTEQHVLVERQFTEAEEARFLVVGDECVAVYGKLPPSVVGDGERSVRELVEAKNRERARNPHLRNRLITLTPHRLSELTRHGYAPDDVPPAGQRLVLDLNANISAGGDSFDRTDDVHPSYKEVAVLAAAAVGGLEPAGVDILARDFRAPAGPENHIVCEVNSRPALGAHHHPAQGTPQPAARDIVEHTLKVTVGAGPPRWIAGSAIQVQHTGELLGRLRDPDARLIAAEWERRGYPVRWVTENFFVVDTGSDVVGYWRSGTSLTMSTGIAATSRKDFTRSLVSRAGLPIAPGRRFRNFRSAGSRARAAELAGSLGTVTVKPLDGAGRSGLTLAVRGQERFEQAWERAAEHTVAGVLVEQHVVGHTARFLVVADRCVAVRRRDDGADVTDAVHPSYREIAVRAVHALPGLDLASVDVIGHDFGNPARLGRYAIVDADSTPSIHEYHVPTRGAPHDVAGAIVDHHLSTLSRS